MKIKKLWSALLFCGLLLSGCKGEPSSSFENPTCCGELPPQVELRAISPVDIPSNAKIKVAGNFNDWNPFADGYDLAHLKDNIYFIVLDFDYSLIGSKITYKFALIYEGQSPTDPWAYEEVTSEGYPVQNRTATIEEGRIRMDARIGGFKDSMSVSTVTRGKLEKVTLTMPQFSDNRKRTIRIWLPDGYDQNDKTKKYPVFYMHDGQNLFDKYTAYAGEWQVDESIGAMMDQGYAGTIVVGIDNGGGERLNEYSPSAFAIKSENNEYNIVGEGEKHAAFVVETLKPYIDQNFNTLSDKTNTGIGGSSMGGIISFFTSLSYQDVFGYALIFSSSFWLYEEASINSFFDAKVTSPMTLPKLYLYHGDSEGSSAYLTTLRDALNAKGVPSTTYTTYVGVGRAHDEPSWAKEFPRGYKWLVGFNG
ncbi:MAG: alpha/beta hydrolase-fold protein [Bacilli bacterium]|nr:alpha/beta hydrolase-fold protein [Bacilli bacterium]